MVSTPPYSQFSTPRPVEDFLDALAGPLLDRCRLGRPALGLAYYEGQRPDPRWREALDQWGRTRGLFIEHSRLAELGDSPIRRLLARHRVGEHLFSLEILPDDLPAAALDRPTAVADLNIHRDTFRDQNVALLLWVPLRTRGDFWNSRRISWTGSGRAAVSRAGRPNAR
jgi:hypothetical protein